MAKKQSEIIREKWEKSYSHIPEYVFKEVAKATMDAIEEINTILSHGPDLQMSILCQVSTLPDYASIKRKVIDPLNLVVANSANLGIVIENVEKLYSLCSKDPAVIKGYHLDSLTELGEVDIGYDGYSIMKYEPGSAEYRRIADSHLTSISRFVKEEIFANIEMLKSQEVAVEQPVSSFRDRLDAESKKATGVAVEFK